MYSDLDLWPITLDQGHDTSLGPGQQFCEILFRSTKRFRSYGPDKLFRTDAIRRTPDTGRTDGQRHNIIRPVWRRAYKNIIYILHFEAYISCVLCYSVVKIRSRWDLPKLRNEQWMKGARVSGRKQELIERWIRFLFGSVFVFVFFHFNLYWSDEFDRLLSVHSHYASPLHLVPTSDSATLNQGEITATVSWVKYPIVGHRVHRYKMEFR